MKTKMILMGIGLWTLVLFSGAYAQSGGGGGGSFFGSDGSGAGMAGYAMGSSEGSLPNDFTGSSNLVKVTYSISVAGAEVSENTCIGVMIARIKRDPMFSGMGGMSGGMGSMAGGGMGGGGTTFMDEVVVAVPNSILQSDVESQFQDTNLDGSATLTFVAPSGRNYEASGSLPMIAGEIAFVRFLVTQQESVEFVSQPKFRKNRKVAKESEMLVIGLDEQGTFKKIGEVKVGETIKLPESENGVINNAFGVEGLVILGKLVDMDAIFSSYFKSRETEAKNQIEKNRRAEVSIDMSGMGSGSMGPGAGMMSGPVPSAYAPEGIPMALIQAMRSATSKEGKEKTEQALRAIIAEEFDATQAKTQAEIEALSQRLDTLKASEKERKTNREKIIDERIKSLMSTR